MGTYHVLSWDVSVYLLAFHSSKHDGLAGTRFGWGLVKDAKLADDMLKAIMAISLSSSVDIELRVLNSMQAILSESQLLPQ